MITMTKAEAIARQAAQIAHYSQQFTNVTALVAAATTADALEDGVEYDLVTINRHIPRGGAIEQMLGINSFARLI